MYPSYIAENQEELFESAPEYIQGLILDGELDQTVVTLGEKYKIPVGKQSSLYDLVSFILTGALQPDDVLQALEDMVGVDNATALHVAEDLEHSILEKARVSLFKKGDPSKVTKLEFQGTRSKEELRKEILDTTKRESALVKSPVATTAQGVKKTSVLNPGSRSQLMEQLQILSTIPDDEEIIARLAHIQEQINSIKKQEEDNSLKSNIALKSFMFGEKGQEVAETKTRPATYSIAPKEYNVDPYKEIVG
jgi:hypothetical protein